MERLRLRAEQKNPSEYRAERASVLKKITFSMPDTELKDGGLAVGVQEDEYVRAILTAHPVGCLSIRLIEKNLSRAWASVWL